MGRVKLKIQRLESLSSRQITYGKRRAGILKKAQEISVLCDIDIILLMFSPTGKPSIFRGQRSNIDEMIAKYAQLTPKERAKRRLESLETLKRNFKKLDQDVDIEEFLDGSSSSIEVMHNQVGMMQAQLSEVRKRLSWWTNPDKTEDIEHLNQMENSLRESLNMVRIHKEKFANETQIPFDCTNQFQNGMQFPMTTNDFQTQPWLPVPDNQHMMMPNEPHFLPNREIDHKDTSFPSCSGFFDDFKEPNLENAGQLKMDRQDDIAIEDYTNSAQLKLPLSDQYLYHPYGNLNFPDVMGLARETNFQPSSIKFQPSSLDCQINGNFEIPRSVYDNLQHSLVPTAGSCAMSMFYENSFPQPPN